MKSALHQIGKTSLAATLSDVVLLPTQTIHTAVLSVSQQPLMLVQGVAPNMLMALSDSGSVALTYTPDSISRYGNDTFSASNSFNPMYYDPNTRYKLPKKVALSSGQVQVQDYPKPNFTTAWRSRST